LETKPIDTQLDHVPGPEKLRRIEAETHPRRRSRGKHVARQQGHERAQVRNKERDSENEVGRVAVLLFLAVVFLINNSLRLALFSQRFLIRSMQLVGAKRWFIQRPFLFQAMWHGALAGLLSCAMLYSLVSFAIIDAEAIE
jgi:hypothetical protein